MTCPPPPYPYSSWDQRPATHAPWQMGCDLYEAYGRFLDRLRADKFDDGDGGWCDRGALYKSAGGVSKGEVYSDAGRYDSDFGYTTEEQCEQHKKREMEKAKRAQFVDAAAKAANDKIKADSIAYEDYQSSLLQLLRTKGPRTVEQIIADLGHPPKFSLNGAIQKLKNNRALKIVRIPKTTKFLITYVENITQSPTP